MDLLHDPVHLAYQPPRHSLRVELESCLLGVEELGAEGSEGSEGSEGMTGKHKNKHGACKVTAIQLTTLHLLQPQETLTYSILFSKPHHRDQVLPTWLSKRCT